MSRVTSFEKLSGPAIAVAMLVLLLPVASACQVPPPSVSRQASVDTETVGNEIRSSLQEWAAALKAEDVDALASTFTEDAIQFPPNAAPVQGKAAIREAIEAFLNRMSVVVDEQLTDFRVAGDFVITHATWASEITPKDGGDPFKANGYGIEIYQRQPDGSLKVLWVMGTDLTLVDPNQPVQE